MAVNPEWRAWLEDTLGRVRPVRTRAMFGGLGIYAGELFFAVADDGALYVKGDAETHAAYQAEGSHRFRPFGEAGPEMDYWRVPDDVLEDPSRLSEWMERALEVSMRARNRKRRPPE